MASEPNIPPQPPRDRLSRLLAVAVPVTTTAGALFIGILIGGLAGFVVGTTKPPPIEYRETASLAQIHNQCDPLILELQTQLATTVGEVELVKGQLALKESDLLLLEPMIAAQGEAPSASDGRNYLAESDAVHQQITDFSYQLRMLERVRAGIVDQLTRVRERMLIEDEDLANQVAISDLLRDEQGHLRDNEILAAWFAFVTDSQTRICGPEEPEPSDAPGEMTRRDLDCRAAVQRELPAIKAPFVRCLRAGQPAPIAHRPPKGDPLPTFAHALNPSSELVAGWFFLLCDPSL